MTFRVPQEIRDWVAAEAARRGLPDAEIWREMAAAEHARRCFPGGAA